MMMSEHVASGAFLLLDVTPPSVESGRTVSDSLATLTADKLVLESLGVDMRFGVLRQVQVEGYEPTDARAMFSEQLIAGAASGQEAGRAREEQAAARQLTLGLIVLILGCCCCYPLLSLIPEVIATERAQRWGEYIRRCWGGAVEALAVEGQLRHDPPLLPAGSSARCRTWEEEEEEGERMLRERPSGACGSRRDGAMRGAVRVGQTVTAGGRHKE